MHIPLQKALLQDSLVIKADTGQAILDRNGVGRKRKDACEGKDHQVNRVEDIP
jgi:hypothetical protein